MKNLLKALGLAGTVMYAVAFAWADDPEEVYNIVTVGTTELIKLDFVPETNRLSSEVLALSPGNEPNELVLTAKSPGKSAFVIRNKKGIVLRKLKYHVITITQFQRLDSVRRLLRNVEGLTVGYEGSNIVVDGAASQADYERVRRLEGAYPEILNLVRVK